MIKVFVPNCNGKIELTVEELEKLLQEAYEEGKSKSTTYYNPWWSYPSYPYITTSTTTSNLTKDIGSLSGSDTLATSTATKEVNGIKIKVGE